MADNLDLLINLFRRDLAQFLLALPPVSAQRHQHGHILVQNAALFVQKRHQFPANQILPGPKAGDIANDNGHQILRRHQLFQRCPAYRAVRSCVKCLTHILDGRLCRRFQTAHRFCAVKSCLYLRRTVTQPKLFQNTAPLSKSVDAFSGISPERENNFFHDTLLFFRCQLCYTLENRAPSAAPFPKER